MRHHPMKALRLCVWLLAPALLAGIVLSAPAPAPVPAPAPALPQATVAPLAKAEDGFLGEHGLRYRLEVRKKPRPLRLHSLQIDLQNPMIEVVAVLAADPDGDGPATAELTTPTRLARRAKAIALVNANPWHAVPDASGKVTTAWYAGQPVSIQGLAVSDGIQRSPPCKGACGLWWDDAGRPHVGDPPEGAKVREAVGGFKQILTEGKVTCRPDDLNPRTAVGLDADGRTLTLLVVDGRQAGYSEGMSCEELAQAMLALGCRNAVNLDGGGSSIMLLADKAGAAPRVVNDPSTKVNNQSVARPLPTALVVRLKDRAAAP